MTNWLTPASRQDLISRLRLQHAWQQRLAARDPADYRQILRIGSGVGPLFCEVLQAWQQRDFLALDPAWRALAGLTENATVRRAYLERPRGHSKTTDTAIQVTWILQWSPHTLRGLAAAADQEQATLIHTAIADLVRHNPVLCPDLMVQKQVIRNRHTGSQLQVISSDVSSSWGQLPDFVICDEVCHWAKPDLWYSLSSSAAKKPGCVLVVLTNAGIGTGWQWELRETARTSAEWYFSSLQGPQAPWITPASLAEQQRLLPPSVYARLWENAWQHSDGEFVTLAEVAACRDSRLMLRSHGHAEFDYVAAIDYAEKHDRTVGVVVHREGPTMIVDRMDVVAPSADQPVLVQWVEDWIAHIAAHFPRVRFVLDEYQLLGVIQRLSAKYRLQRFDFAAGRGNHALALTLRNLIVHQQVRWYPGCGQLANSPTCDDLETELAALVLRTNSGGRVRIDHRRQPCCHDDRAFALGAACLELTRESATNHDWFEVTMPTAAGEFGW
ncbi:terminase [bacterium]|nr:terminase [bacterium]